MAKFGDMFRSPDAQAQLAAEQRQATDQLAQLQQNQQRELDTLAGQRALDYDNQAELIQRQQRELEQLVELRRRSLELDADNRELHTQLAQTQQRNRLMEDETNLLRQQLTDAANQLSTALKAQQEGDRRYMLAQDEADRRVSALQANLPRQGSATIRANSSLRQSLTPITIAGLEVRQDGDVVRVELPSDKIFASGTASLTEEASSLLDAVAAALKQNYAQQIIGIEAHTDAGPAPTGAWQSRHQLSAAQAMAIFDQLVQRHQFDPRQLFVLGHGPNYPIASNATPAGQQRNRRVEIVIYPEMVGQSPP